MNVNKKAAISGGMGNTLKASIEEVFDLFTSAGVTELSKRLSFDLTDTFTGNVKSLTYFLKSTGFAVLKTETELQYFCFTVC